MERPELLLYGEVELQDRLLKVIEDVWEERAVVGDWKDAEIFPIPKKGNLNLCDNWLGIWLLDAVGKVFGRLCRRDYKQLQKGSSQSHSVVSGRDGGCDHDLRSTPAGKEEPRTCY